MMYPFADTIESAVHALNKFRSYLYRPHSIMYR